MFNKYNCIIMNECDKSIVFKGRRKGNVYKINFFELTNRKVICLLLVSDEKWLWNRRLRHDNSRLIFKLSKLNFVKHFPELNYHHSNALCGACQVGKINKTSFKSNNIVSTSRLLELFDIDLFGPIGNTSINEKKYVLVIVYDYNIWTWVKFYITKCEPYDVFNNFCIQVQTKIESKILKVKSDHGGEFENDPLKTFMNNMELSMSSLLLEFQKKWSYCSLEIRR